MDDEPTYMKCDGCGYTFNINFLHVMEGDELNCEECVTYLQEDMRAN